MSFFGHKHTYVYDSCLNKFQLKLEFFTLCSSLSIQKIFRILENFLAAQRKPCRSLDISDTYSIGEGQDAGSFLAVHHDGRHSKSGGSHQQCQTDGHGGR
jgi:hypothetical protein